MEQHWQPFIEHDPCYNPNLALAHPDYSLREPQQIRDQELIEMATQLKQTKKQLQRTQAQLALVEEEKNQAIDRVYAMETSKFWQLRKRWFKLRSLAGIPGQE